MVVYNLVKLLKVGSTSFLIVSRGAEISAGNAGLISGAEGIDNVTLPFLGGVIEKSVAKPKSSPIFVKCPLISSANSNVSFIQQTSMFLIRNSEWNPKVLHKYL